MRIFSYGKIFEWLFPKRLWAIKTTQKVIYLTFDDGPIPEVTPYVLEELNKVNAKATFFVVGDNVRKHPEIYQQVVSGGHEVGNHTMHHLKGSKTLNSSYLKDVREAQAYILKENPRRLFRPPYGRLSRAQARALPDFKVVMWSVLGYDFDPSLPPEECLKKLKQLTKPGSIVLLHDSLKTIEKLKHVLPPYLKHFSDLGYQFKCL